MTLCSNNSIVLIGHIIGNIGDLCKSGNTPLVPCCKKTLFLIVASMHLLLIGSWPYWCFLPLWLSISFHVITCVPLKKKWQRCVLRSSARMAKARPMEEDPPSWLHPMRCPFPWSMITVLVPHRSESDICPVDLRISVVPRGLLYRLRSKKL